MNRNVVVGLFVLVGLGLFTAGLFLIGDRNQAFAEHFIVYADFANLSGIAKGTKVQVAGMTAGQVQEIAVPSSPASRFRLKIQLDEKLHGLVRTDSVATIGTEGVVGDTFLTVQPGSMASPSAPSGAVLKSKEQLQLSDLLDQAKGTITDVDTAVRNANGILTSVGGNLNATLITAHGTLSDVDGIVKSVQHGEGAAGVLIRDPKVADSVRQIVTNVQQTSKNLQETSAQASTFVADINARAFPQKIDDTLASVRDATARIDGTTQDVQKMVGEIVAPDAGGATAGTKLREAISNMDAAAGNFADDTEALKRSFLVRGFFRRRGYYNLTGMAPDAYRKDSTFTNSNNLRLWVDQRGLFLRNSKGEDELTPDGKLLIDQQIAQHGELLPAVPIVVEGYQGTGGPADQVASSRQRALLVRGYLISRYHLEPTGIGAIGLSDAAPHGSEHSTWDGICIVLVRRAH